MGRWLLYWLARGIFRSSIDRAIAEHADAFFGHLRANGYPSAGELIVINNTDLDRTKFMGALLWALDKTLETEELTDE